MTKSVKTLIAVLAIAVCAVVGASTAQAALSSFTCNNSGTVGGSWTGSCTLSIGGTMSCKGTNTGTQTSGTETGTCSGTTTFGKTSCTLNGNYTGNTANNTFTDSGTVSCKAGITTCSGTYTGSGTVKTKGTRQTFTSTQKGSC